MKAIPHEKLPRNFSSRAKSSITPFKERHKLTPTGVEGGVQGAQPNKRTTSESLVWETDASQVCSGQFHLMVPTSCSEDAGLLGREAKIKTNPRQGNKRKRIKVGKRNEIISVFRFFAFYINLARLVRSLSTYPLATASVTYFALQEAACLFLPRIVDVKCYSTCIFSHH